MDLKTLKYIVTHVFFPLRLPDGDDQSIMNDYALAGAVASAAHLYHDHPSNATVYQWRSIIGMLDNMHAAAEFERLDSSGTISQLKSMDVGDIRVFLIRAQNAAVIFRMQQDATIFESFEVSPKAEDVMATRGKLVCSYPGPAIEIPAVVFGDPCFLSELVNFLVHMNDDILDAASTTVKARSIVQEARDTTHPRYITELLTGILRGVGRPADVIRISKRVSDDVVWNNTKLPWRRSSLWLLSRVALQTSLDQSPAVPHTYKTFMLYFMCCLAKEEACAQLPNDLLYAMSTKISRRLRKINSFVPDWLSNTVVQTCTFLRSTLESRWRQVRDAQCASPLWAPSQLDLTRDIQLSLLNSQSYLRSSLASQNISPSQGKFQYNHHPRGTLEDFLSSDGAFFEKSYRAEPHVTLYDVEHEVEQGIDTWVGQVTNADGACVKLEVLASKYSSKALETYKNNPELMSTMFLTMIELWVALDKIVIKEIPMLADYSPEVPTSLLESLLLCKERSLCRLRSAHEYISCRYTSSNGGRSVFSSAITAESFAVRFYRRSRHLQHLKARVEAAAQDRVHQKVAELEEANARHAELERMVAEIDHRFTVDKNYASTHAKDCVKCNYERRLESMKIDIYEWPLPARQLHAEVVVFELDCPVSFNMWRSATFHLLVDVCAPPVKPKPPFIQLHQYTELKSYFVRHPRSRISLGSDTKPFGATHYNKVSIPTKQERVCVNNGMVCYGFDRHAGIPVSQVPAGINISPHCTYQLRSGSYQGQQKYVDSTSHTSNEVIADQADCHQDLSAHEFIAFGHLRSGGSLQWCNVLRELRGRSLSFHRYEVHFLLAQAASQVGPFANGKWTWHQEIQQPSFCYALLEELGKLLQDVEANWLEGVTMDTISFLLRRLLASSPDKVVSQKALRLLRITRNKVFAWIQELSDKLINTPVDKGLCGVLRDAAAVCRSTFDMDLAVIPKLLHSAEDIKTLLSSAILIHHHTPKKVSSIPTYSQLLLDRNRRVSLTLEGVVRDVIQTDFGDQGINLAVSWVWPDYRPGSRWTPLRSPNSRWLSCTTAATASQNSQVVHFNLVDGTLLINGKPLGRLPNEILQHPLYKQIFGEQVLDTMPGDLPGMGYSTRDRISGHQVHFSLRGKELVVQATATSSSEVMELIPPQRLKGDLPEALINEHVHWLNLSKSIMEIRPHDSLWKTSSENWAIHLTPRRCCMRRGDEFLIDTRSKSWDMISSLLKPLDIPQNLIVTASPINPNRPSSPLQLSVGLPRYGLSFYVNECGDLQSHNIRDMVYDKNQAIGALFGLINRLVLRPKLRDNVDLDELVPRCILIPEGKVSFRMDGHHVRIGIDTCTPTFQRVTYQIYKIDTGLGCLVGNASLTNKLFCAYLHALTNGYSTDPLTGRLGTEEALSLLQSASYWSAMKLSSRDAELLHMIASICPSRTWYPKHLKRMQQVEWLDLPVSSQHYGLYLICSEIKRHYEQIQLFHEGQSNTFMPDFRLHDVHLLERSTQRAAYPFLSDISWKSSADLDARYPARDLVEATSGEYRACTAATVVYRRRTSSTINEGLVLNLLKTWTTVSGDTSLSLQYDRSWLTPVLSSIWLKAYNLLRRNGEEKWFQMLFSLPAMAYASPKLADLLPAFVAFAMESQFLSEDPPHCNSYNLSVGYGLPLSTLRGHVLNSAIPFERSPESTEPAETGENAENLQRRRRKMYDNRRNLDVDSAVRQLSKAWPCETPPQCSLNPRLYDVKQLTSNVQNFFSRRYHNLRLREHLTRVQNNVQFRASPTPTLRYSFTPLQSVPSRTSWSITMGQLFTRPAPSLRSRDGLPRLTTEIEVTSLSGCAPLCRLIDTVETNAVNPFQRQYISTLRASADCFAAETSRGAIRATELPTAEAIKAYYARCSASYIKELKHIKQYLGPKNGSEQALQQSGQWPRITPYTLFQALASNSPTILSDNWKACLIKLTLLALELQRARRLLRLHFDSLHEEFRREVENEGHDGWSPEVHPDWLLIQLQGNFLIRRVQADVANEMIAPHSGSNTAMQLNMGEGKSSVIVPIVVVDLADGNQLVRIIIPKALTAQMFHLLVDRIGGLVNRRIYFIPFSRSLEVNRQKVTVLHKIMSDCMKGRGILVVQPEHILSLRLVSVEKQLPRLGVKDTPLAHQLLEFQKWLHVHSRDILDESDEILHVRYQLVYTIGLQQHMEGFPERWTTTQQVLGLVSKNAFYLQEHFPLGVEFQHGLFGSFPHLRISSADAGQELISRIVQDVIGGLLPNFSFAQLCLGLRNAIRTFISCEHVHPDEVQLVRKHFQQTHLWGGLLLLRGLLATGILLYVFRDRRWRVDYGLNPARTMLAVPFRAKDVPAQRAEFGHPDIAIILTCLSYYYSGLSQEQLRLCFEILLRQEDPTLDYDLWVRDCPNVPIFLRTLSGINIKSSEQWKKLLYPLFSQNRAAVNFYLSSVVFPKEAKEFPSKLSCSGWDLAEKKERLLTGFSGTNDGQYLLPLHVTQRDPDHQRGTNAKVLSYLLQPENKHYMCMTHENGKRRTTHEFLKILADQKPAIRVLLDVGAQMLDLQNHELAEAWLDINRDVSAAIYFNGDDELTVCTRDGSIQPFISSPFAQQLDQCVVYLDDAHTRGTDIRFPGRFRAAVTLGPKVTKDRLTQGCMRMRKLGHGHSVMFFAPLEVDRRIRLTADKKDPLVPINTMDILHWAIRETCEDIQHRAPHWAQQGMDHTSRYSAWTSFCSDQLSPQALSDEWLQPEAKRLETLYQPRDTSNPFSLAIPDIRQRCIELGILTLRDVGMDEEQEREVIHEAERERQVERPPPKVTPASHSIHPDVVKFIKTGTIPICTDAFYPAFATLNATAAVTKEVYVWSPLLLATADFQKTVKSTGKMDQYLRPVQWVISGKRNGKEVLVIPSPYEVNRLMPYIRLSNSVHLHVYTPRVTRSMMPCDDLTLYNMPKVPAEWRSPSSLMDQLNVFAGQLYLKDYKTYIRLCRFLCVYARDLEDEQGMEVGCDGFISPSTRPKRLQTAAPTFRSSPMKSLTTLMGLRRKGMRFGPTHMGKLLNGQLLAEDEFDSAVGTIEVTD